MKQIILSVILIIVVTIINFYGDNIYYNYQIYTFKTNYKENTNNNYSKDENYNFVKINNNLELNNKKDITNSLYTLLNSGNSSIKRYCNKEYTSCVNDITNIAKDEELLSYINSFVHPYNSFASVTFSYDDILRLTISYKKIYTEEKINLINNKIDTFITNNITIDMSIEDKIKAFHDYIVNNTKYDLLKKQDIHDTTYESNTAYGVLFQGYGICSGYADAMAIYLSRLGLPNYKISNDTHIWNLVYINNNWLHLDLTWDDPVYEDTNIDSISYEYYLITTKKLYELNNKEHIFDSSIYKEASL